MKPINPTLSYSCPSVPSLLPLPSFSFPSLNLFQGERKANNDGLFTLQVILFSFDTDVKMNQVFKSEKTESYDLPLTFV